MYALCRMPVTFFNKLFLLLRISFIRACVCRLTVHPLRRPRSCLFFRPSQRKKICYAKEDWPCLELFLNTLCVLCIFCTAALKSLSADLMHKFQLRCRSVGVLLITASRFFCRQVHAMRLSHSPRWCLKELV
jgi:hypothetical protein